MISRLPRNRRTTVPWRPLGTACKSAAIIAAFVAMSATPVLAQYQRPGYPTPTGTGQPTPSIPVPSNLPVPGSQGQVLYFCKPADSLVPLSGSGTVPVAGASGVADSGSPQIPVAPQATLPLPIAPPAAPPAPAQPMIPQPPAIVIPTSPAPMVAFPQTPATAIAMQPPVPKPVTPNPPPGIKPMTPPDYAELAPEYRTDLPPRSVIFKMFTPKELEEWVMDKVSQSQNIPLQELHFPPEEPVALGQTYHAKTANYPPQKAVIEPLYLVHRRLLFEEINAERYGWDLGVIQPLVSAAFFYADFFLLPETLVSGFAQGFWDTSAGKCLPGSPTPYILYPPGLTVSGSLAEAAVITGLSFAIP